MTCAQTHFATNVMQMYGNHHVYQFKGVSLHK